MLLGDEADHDREGDVQRLWISLGPFSANPFRLWLVALCSDQDHSGVIWDGMEKGNRMEWKDERGIVLLLASESLLVGAK